MSWSQGELLVTPAPQMRHQLTLSRLFAALSRYLADHDDVELLVSPADIQWPEEVLVQPDLFVVPVAELTAQNWSSIRTLLLAVEVVSPNSARHDRVPKRRVYQRQRVATHWIVDPDARMVEAWHPEDERPEIVTDVLRWRVRAEGEELEIELGEFFAAP